MNRVALLAASAVLSLAASAHAGTVFFDGFDGNSSGNLAAKNFASGATTGFNYWNTAGVGGDMDAGYFSVVNKARDVHSQFHSSLDANGAANGRYAIFNGFQNAQGTAYSIAFNNLVAGETYNFSYSAISLAGSPPYPQISDLIARHNGSDLGTKYTVVPVPYGQEQWITVSRSFIATAGTNTLAIYNLAGASNSGNDFGLDNITLSNNSLNITGTAVPLPASASAGAAGLAALLLARSRNRR